MAAAGASYGGYSTLMGLIREPEMYRCGVAFAAVSDIVVAEVSARQMIDTFQRMPRLGAAILWAASRDEALVVEHLVSIGRRSADRAPLTTDVRR